MNRESSFSLTVLVIIMALLAIFIGYLLGNWIIQLVTGNNPNTHQVAQQKIVEEEIVGDNNQISSKDNSSNQSSSSTSSEQSLQQQYLQQQLKGDVFTIQVGAFKNYNNALRLKEELADKGFQPIITEGVPYKVQLGATIDRGKAEETKKKLKALGYDAFITH